MLVTPRRARRPTSVHPAAPIRHRWRLALAAVPRPRAASQAEVHGRFALHGVDPLISLDPLPDRRPPWSFDPREECFRGKLARPLADRAVRIRSRRLRHNRRWRAATSMGLDSCVSCYFRHVGSYGIGARPAQMSTARCRSPDATLQSYLAYFGQ